MTHKTAEVTRVGVAFTLIAAVIALYWPGFAALGQLWQDGARTTYTHGYLVGAISLWLLLRERHELRQPGLPRAGVAQRALILLVLLVVAVSWQFAYRAGIQLLVEILLLPLLWLPIWLLLGGRAARASCLPVALLLFALPFWDVLTPVLQFASVHAARVLLRLAGVPVFFHGNDVEIPDAVFRIEGGCSGLHYFIVSLAIATLIGEMRRDRWPRRVFILLLAAVLAVLTNWLRVASIIYIGHVTDMQSYLVRVSHYGYGWVLFALAILALFLIARRMPFAELRDAQTPDAADRPPLAGVGMAMWSAACALVLLLPITMNSIVTARLASAPTETALPDAPVGWQQSDTPESDWQPVQVDADEESHRLFVRDGVKIELYVARYREQRLGKKLGGYVNRPQGVAEVVEAGILTNTPDSSYMVIDQNGRKSLLVLTYRVAGRAFASALRAQAWYSWQTLRSMFSPPSVVESWRTPCEPNCDQARALLEKFIALDGRHS
jgi:exosortase A